MSSFPATQAAYSSPLLFISRLCILGEKAWTSLDFLWPGPAEPGPLANASCHHFELHSCSLVPTHASLHSCGWDTPNGAVTSPFMLLHFHGSLVHNLCLLSIITVQCITITLAPLFRLSYSFVLCVGCGAIFFFLIKGLCLRYQVLNEDFIAYTIIIRVPINSTNWYLQL